MWVLAAIPIVGGVATALLRGSPQVLALTTHSYLGPQGMTMNAELACTLEELTEVLATAAFIKPYSLRVSSYGPGECTVVVPYSPSLDRPGGIVNGMMIMGVADVAMWLAIMSRRGTAERWVTTNMTIRLFT